MTTPAVHRMARRAGALACLAVCLPLFAAPALGQLNFKPLTRGDYEETEEKQIVLRGLDAGVDYANRLGSLRGDNIPKDMLGTRHYTDIRLHLNTVMHRDVSLRLTLQPDETTVRSDNLRQEYPSTEHGKGRMAEGQSSAVTFRDAYLRWAYNPGSAILAGKHEISIGDRRGKVFNAITNAVTFDCKVGTWCMPFGYAQMGPKGGDALYHWGLEYTAWELPRESSALNDLFKVEVFRVVYNEWNIPLGRNLGPTARDYSDPLLPDDSQITDTTGGGSSPVYYDAREQDYYGLRLNWESGVMFYNLDAVGMRGNRHYHHYRDPEIGISTNIYGGAAGKIKVKTKGRVFETELGTRWETGRVGLRFMEASGDPYLADPDAPRNVKRNLEGYYEILPGAYRGSRLYFNGADSDLDSGAGLGHSINNTRLYGLFLDVNERASRKMAYNMGIYKLEKVHSIPSSDGPPQRDIGVEMNNLITWYIHEAIRLQTEINFIEIGPAFTYADHLTPRKKTGRVVQSLARFIYQF